MEIRQYREGAPYVKFSVGDFVEVDGLPYLQGTIVDFSLSHHFAIINLENGFWNEEHTTFIQHLVVHVSGLAHFTWMDVAPPPLAAPRWIEFNKDVEP